MITLTLYLSPLGPNILIYFQGQTQQQQKHQIKSSLDLIFVWDIDYDTTQKQLNVCMFAILKNASDSPIWSQGDPSSNISVSFQVQTLNLQNS